MSNLTTNASYDPRPSLVVHPQQMILLLESVVISLNTSSPVPPYLFLASIFRLMSNLTTNASYDPRPSLAVRPQQMILLLESIAEL